MKLIVVNFDDSVDVSSIPVGASVNIGSGTITLSGLVMAITQMEEPPEQELIPHTHNASIDIGSTTELA